MNLFDTVFYQTADNHVSKSIIKTVSDLSRRHRFII